MHCNASCPIKFYEDEDHFACRNTPYRNFWKERDCESALVELNFLRKVYLDFLEDELQGKLDGLGMVIEREIIKEEEYPRDVTEELSFVINPFHPGGYFIDFYHEGTIVGFLGYEGITISNADMFKIEKEAYGDAFCIMRIEK